MLRRSRPGFHRRSAPSGSVDICPRKPARWNPFGNNPSHAPTKRDRLFRPIRGWARPRFPRPVSLLFPVLRPFHEHRHRRHHGQCAGYCNTGTPSMGMPIMDPCCSARCMSASGPDFFRADRWKNSSGPCFLLVTRLNSKVDDLLMNSCCGWFLFDVAF